MSVESAFCLNEATEKGEDRKVELLLYRNHNGSDETGEAYRPLHLRVDVD